MKKFVIALVALFPLVACTSAPPKPPVIEYSQDDEEFVEKYKEVSHSKYKLGKAYKVKDEWYFPAHEPSYDKEGIASWYGPGFEGNFTANGEVMRADDFTAAHPTLPMPCIVEVTNLDNGKKINVRVNDRGPFHSDRIIDLSRAAAKQLDMMKSGTANVRVKLLARETLEYLEYATASR